LLTFHASIYILRRYREFFLTPAASLIKAKPSRHHRLAV
jgi:hypothetical protein